jgi:tryptophan synthase alpha chain
VARRAPGVVLVLLEQWTLCGPGDLNALVQMAVDAEEVGVETVMLVAPTSPDDRLARIAARSRGFLYTVGLLGVTGERDELASTAVALASRPKRATDLPVLVGVGVSNAAQAAEAVGVADGVVQGASVVRRLMEQGPDAVGEYVAEVRSAIDAVGRRAQG